MSCVKVVVKCRRCGKLDAAVDFAAHPTAAERKAAARLILDIHTGTAHPRVRPVEGRTGAPQRRRRSHA